MGLLFKDLFNGSKPVNGELTINLNLTIKIEADGSLSVLPAAVAASEKPQITPPKDQAKEEKIEYAIPEFDVGDGQIINFGKNV